MSQVVKRNLKLMMYFRLTLKFKMDFKLGYRCPLISPVLYNISQIITASSSNATLHVHHLDESSTFEWKKVVAISNFPLQLKVLLLLHFYTKTQITKHPKLHLENWMRETRKVVTKFTLTNLNCIKWKFCITEDISLIFV